MAFNPLESRTANDADRPRALERGAASPGAYRWQRIEDADGLWRLFRARAWAAHQDDGTDFDLVEYRVRIDPDDLRSDHFAIAPAHTNDSPPVAYLRLVHSDARIRSKRTVDLLQCCEIRLQHMELAPRGGASAFSNSGWLGAQIEDSIHRGCTVVEAQWLAHAGEAPLPATGEEAWRLVREMGVAANATHVVWCGELRDVNRAAV